MVLLLAIGLAFAALFGYLLWINKVKPGVCSCTNRMHGKTVIVTGANCGIGKEAALDLAARGAKVILACRDLKKADEARDDIVAATGSRKVVIRHLDLESLKSIRRFAEGIIETEDRLDVLINNAGAGGLTDDLTEDGLVKGMQVNHFGPFLLTCLLLGLLKKTPSSRIVVVSSAIHSLSGSFDVDNMNCEKSPIHGFYMYAYSKLCNILMTLYLAEKLKGTGITVNCLHPGAVHTDLFRNIPNKWILLFTNQAASIFLKSPRDGAQTTIHLAVSDEGGRVTGKYFIDVKETSVSKTAKVPGLAEKVWTRSEKYVGLLEEERPFK